MVKGELPKVEASNDYINTAIWLKAKSRRREQLHGASRPGGKLRWMRNKGCEINYWILAIAYLEVRPKMLFAGCRIAGGNGQTGEGSGSAY